jgi:phage FluMu protein Com
MGETVRKSIMLGVIVACLVGAGLITLRNLRGGELDVKEYENQSTWVKCRNLACNAAYEMNVARYYKFVYKNTGRGDVEAAALRCKACGEPSVYKAVKCASCELIFERGTVQADFSDRCPECGYSLIEATRKETTEAWQAGM